MEMFQMSHIFEREFLKLIYFFEKNYWNAKEVASMVLVLKEEYFADSLYVSSILIWTNKFARKDFKGKISSRETTLDLPFARDFGQHFLNRTIHLEIQGD